MMNFKSATPPPRSNSPPEACAERLAAYVEAGATSFQCVLATVDQAARMERVATELLPLLAA